MINKISNFTYKSFVNYTCPDEISFKTKNVFFGSNGRGKTSLTEGIKNEVLSDPNLKECNIRIYSKNYLSIKLVNSATSRLKGIKAILGNKNVVNSEKIEELKSKIKSSSLKEKENDGLITNINDIVKEIESGLKGKLNIHHFNVTKYINNLDEFIDSTNIAYKKALEIVSDDKLDLVSANQDFDSQRDSVKSLINLNIEINEDDLIEFFKIATKSYSSDTVPSKDFLDWIEKGIEFSKNNICPFCGTKNIDIKYIKEEFDEFVKNEKHVDTQKTKILKERIERQIDIIKNIIAKKADYTKINLDFNNDIEQLNGIMPSLIELLNSCIDKLNNFCEIYTFEFDYENLINKLNEISKSIGNKIIAEFGQIDKEESQKNNLVKGLIAKRILKNESIQDKIKMYKENLVKINAINKENTAINLEISKLKNNATPIGDFAGYVNDIFDSLDIKFRLDIDGSDYVIKPFNSENEIKVDDISEGEKNLLSFLFFYYELFENLEGENIKEEIKVIIIDDPISSLDDNNQIFLTSLFKDLLKIENIQLFLLTHNWNVFCNVLYGVEKDKNICTFEICKDDAGQSKIVKIKNTISPYEYDFIQLLTYENKAESELDENVIYSLPNCMRRVLETFLSFKVADNSPTAKNINNVKLALLKEDEGDKHILPLTTLLNVINVRSHSAQRSKAEVIASLKFLLKCIKKSDIRHYNNMKAKEAQFHQINTP